MLKLTLKDCLCMRTIVGIDGTAASEHFGFIFTSSFQCVFSYEGIMSLHHQLLFSMGTRLEYQVRKTKENYLSIRFFRSRKTHKLFLSVETCVNQSQEEE